MDNPALSSPKVKGPVINPRFPKLARNALVFDIATALAAVALGLLSRQVLVHLSGIRVPYLGFFFWIAAAGLVASTRSAILTLLTFAILSVLPLEPTTLIPTATPTIGLVLFLIVSSVFIAATDWTNRLRRRERAALSNLRESEQRLRLALEAGDMGTWEWIIPTGAFAWSTGFARIHPRLSPSLHGTFDDLLSVVHADDRPQISAAVQDALARRGEFRTEYRVTTADTEHWLESRGRVICDPTGRPIRMVGVCMDISDQRRTEQNLRASQQRYQALAEAMPEFVWSCSADGNVEYLNPQYIAFTGVELDRINNGGWQEIVHPDDIPAIAHFWSQSLATGNPFELEYRFRRKNDGSYRWFLTRTLPVRDEHQSVIRWVGAATDIHDSKMAREEREKLLSAERSAREEAERASQIKDQFLAMLSHELRTPLTPVLMTVSLLEASPDLPPELRADIVSIRRSVELEARLIDDLLDLTRLARGKIRYDFQIVDVHLLVRSAVAICCNDGKHDLRVDLAAQAHHVQADPARLQQVFWNLLNNAWKFTAPGGQIAITSASHDGRIRISVTDNGCGIEPDLLPRVFDAFEQGDAIRARRFGGLGLGLAICKALVDAHGGAISVTSEGPGRGATFSVDLPCVPSPNSIDQSIHPPRIAAAPDRRRLSMLLIEDHPDTLKALSKLLRNSGHEVEGAASVNDGLRAAARKHYDLVISDLGLPDGTGFELMRELQRLYGLRGIALSGYGMEDDVIKSREAGFCEHLVKPVDVQKLQEAIARVSWSNPAIAADSH